MDPNKQWLIQRIDLKLLIELEFSDGNIRYLLFPQMYSTSSSVGFHIRDPCEQPSQSCIPNNTNSMAVFGLPM